MIRHKLFTSLQEEEHWINSIQSEGYQLVKVTPWTAAYHFEKCSRPLIPYALIFMNILQKENIQITSLYLKTVVGNLYKVVVDAASIIFNKQSKLQAQKFFLIPNRKKHSIHATKIMPTPISDYF